MTTRERWLTAGLVLASVALLVIGFWQQVRLNDAQSAVEAYFQRELKAREAAKQAENGGEDPLFRDARPEIERYLQAGKFGRALQRLTALSEEASLGDARRTGGGLAIDELFPPKSPQREKAREVLRALVEKQKQGYDLSEAQSKLVEVADASREGKKDEALKRFAEVEQKIASAALRPGFRVATAAAGKPGTPPPGAPGDGPLASAMAGDPAAALGGRLPARRDPEIEKVIATIQGLPLMAAQIRRAVPTIEKPDERQQAEDRLAAFDKVWPLVEPLGNELKAAYAQGRHLRPVLPLFFAIGREFQKIIGGEESKELPRMVDAARAAVRSSPMLGPGGPPGAPGAPAIAQAAPGTAPPPGRPSGPAGRPAPTGLPVPPATAPAAPAAGGAGERILAMIDALRRIPEPLYQQQRAHLPEVIGQQLAALIGTAAPPSGGAPAGPVVGDPSRLALALGQQGEIRGLKLGSADLSAGLEPGGFALTLGDQPGLPLRPALQRAGSSWTGLVSGPAGRFWVEYSGGDGKVAIYARSVADRVPARRTGAATPPAAAVLKIPLHSGGWRWTAGGSPQVIAVDGSYSAAPGPDGKLPAVRIEGGGSRLVVTAESASAITCDPRRGWLVVRLPVSLTGVTEHTVRLNVEKT